MDTSCDDHCFGKLGVSCTDFEQAYLKASNPGAEDWFGFTIALDGDTLVVGAPMEDSSVAVGQDDDSAVGSGAVYVFTRTGASWSQQAFLKASNAEADDRFGTSVTVYGDTVVVGAPREAGGARVVNGDETDNSAAFSGAAYVFTRSGTTWTQQAYVKASNADGGDAFGESVVLDGDTLAVGARLEASNATGINGDELNNGAPSSGAVYVFTRSGTTWSQEAYVKASNSQATDQFGFKLALEAETLVVGAHGEDSAATGINADQTDNSAASAGAVYVFTRSGTAWSQQAYIKASNTEADDYFGAWVALSGETLAVAALQESSNATGVDGDELNNDAAESGAVYVFVRSGTVWAQQAYLKMSDAEAGDWVSRVALDGDTLVVGASGEDSDATGLDGDETSNAAVDSGAAYIFRRSGTTWTQHAYNKASNTEAGDLFALPVALDGSPLAVAAWWEGSAAAGVNGDQLDNSASFSGAVYVRQIAP